MSADDSDSNSEIMARLDEHAGLLRQVLDRLAAIEDRRGDQAPDRPVPELITVKQAAERAGVHTCTVLRWIATAPDLAFFGPPWVIYADRFERHLASRRASDAVRHALRGPAGRRTLPGYGRPGSDER